MLKGPSRFCRGPARGQESGHTTVLHCVTSARCRATAQGHSLWHPLRRLLRQLGEESTRSLPSRLPLAARWASDGVTRRSLHDQPQLALLPPPSRRPPGLRVDTGAAAAHAHWDAKVFSLVGPGKAFTPPRASGGGGPAPGSNKDNAASGVCSSHQKARAPW